MRIIDYVKDHIAQMLSEIIFLIFIFFFLKAVTDAVYSAVFVCSLFLFIKIPIMLWDYFKRRKYYQELLSIEEELTKKTLLAHMLPEADFPEAMIMTEVLQNAEKSMNDEISKYKRISQEYREYIEMWIHEVKTPIASAKLTLENNPNETSLSVEEDLDEVEGYVEQALYYARSKSPEKDYIVKKCNLSDLVNEVVRKNRKNFIQKKIHLDVKNMEQQVYTDEKWTCFILNQILRNALNYTGVEGTIRMEAFCEATKICLEIEDNGIGIPGSDLPRIFEKGFTGENGRKFGKATGMGLYLVKTLCGKLGLGVQITSSTGTLVKITFPISDYDILLH